MQDKPPASPETGKPEQPVDNPPPKAPGPLSADDQPPPTFSHPIEPGLRIVTRGCFEPVQAVWQDDEEFADLKTKQLTEISPNQWTAELKMVVAKPTLIFGPKRDHTKIVIQGETNGTRSVPVKFRFTLVDASGEKVIWTQPAATNTVWVDGPTPDSHPFYAELDAAKGIPPGAAAFAIAEGGYGIKCELVREDDTPTGIVVYLEGEAVQTYGPRIYFVAVALSQAHLADEDLLDSARAMESSCNGEIPNFIP